jgi:hypothetical protein
MCMVHSTSYVLCVLAGLVVVSAGQQTGASIDINGSTVHLFTNFSNSSLDFDRLQQTFDLLYDHFNHTFNFSLYDQFMDALGQEAERRQKNDKYSGYAYYPNSPHCDKGVAVGAAAQVTGMAPFPGGISKRIRGEPLSKKVSDMLMSATGPAAAGGVGPMALATAGVATAAGLVQGLIASAIYIVPPLIPPPVWMNQPLTCVPMLTGHNCFGAVLYPITLSDFMTADISDSMLDGYIAGFPNTYATKVGKTSDAMYRACFSAYMSMHCSAVFPRCTLPLSREDPMPVGGVVPMCFHLCIMPLVMCPGFWVGDVIGSCSMVSVPPMCTMAFFMDMSKLPPQYADYDESFPYPKECPPTDTSDASEDPNLFDEVPVPPSPIQKAAKLPTLSLA